MKREAGVSCGGDDATRGSRIPNQSAWVQVPPQLPANARPGAPPPMREALMKFLAPGAWPQPGPAPAVVSIWRVNQHVGALLQVK